MTRRCWFGSCVAAVTSQHYQTQNDFGRGGGRFVGVHACAYDGVALCGQARRQSNSASWTTPTARFLTTACCLPITSHRRAGPTGYACVGPINLGAHWKVAEQRDSVEERLALPKRGGIMIRVPERAQVGAIERHATVVAPAVRCIRL